MSKEQVRFVSDLWHDLMLWIRGPKKQPSLTAWAIYWTTNVPWIPRLEAYKQITDWISVKHNHDTSSHN
jgi:hypothetical protein